MNGFSILFLGALAAMLVAQIWLGLRHICHVQSHRDRVPQAFRDRVPLADHRKAADYTVATTRFGLIDDAAGALLLVLWTLGGGLDLLDRLWRSLGYGPIVTGSAFILSLFLVTGALNLPFSAYQTFVIEERFGFNKTTIGLFIADLAKQALLLAVIGIPLVFAVLWLMQAMGPRWWLYVWALWGGFTLIMVWAYPVLIAPLFNKFSPLGDADVKNRIQSLLDRTGFRSRGIFVMDGSRRSAHGNAYFTGFGKNKRIVFFDTLLETLGGGEIEAVLAHELGHFRRHHVLKRLLLTFGVALAGLYLLAWLMNQAWFYHGLGMSRPSTYAALALFLMAGPVFMFFLQPLRSWSSRRHEFEADAYAAEQADVRALVTALVKLYRENANTLTPDPVYSAFYDSHPPAPVRIARLEALAT
ncbi:MAG: M48 family metallopeptidase [Gammaproteobacteria bacterium]|nr:M48 family metallopeptidase [Gammaproteobacteria bacterium]